ncbi:MAG: ATP-binding protein [Nanoarchaeota archaeon]
MVNNLLKQFIKESSLSENNKLSIKFLVDSINGEINQFTDKSYLFEGSPGIGKTYFVESFLKMLDFPVLYLGPFKLEGKNIRKFDSLKQIMEEIHSLEKGIIYLDDIQNSLEFERDGMGDPHLNDIEGKRFLNLLELVKRSNKKLFLIMTVNDSSFMEDSWKDRIETFIDLLEPFEKSKKIFLNKKYGNLIGKNIINEIASKSIGYNFRNLDEVIRMAYRFGNGIINLKSTNKAFSSYTPSGLANYDIEFKSNLNFNNVFGHNKIKKELKKLALYKNNKNKLDKLQIKRNNFFIFSGNHGIGKTHMARALAGELKLPLIKISAWDIHSPRHGITKIMNTASRYKNCIILIDEADKLLGLHAYSMEEEGVLLGEMNRQIDDAAREIKSIIILSVNNLTRLGKAMKDRFTVLEFNNPPIEDRREFVNNLISKSGLNLSVTAEDIAQMTDGRNYRDIQRIWNDVVFYYLENKEMDKNILTDLIVPININERRVHTGIG